MKENSSENKAPRTVIDRLRFIGPSAIVTGSVVGSGSIVMTPLLGAAAGFTLLWWLLLSIWTKPIIQAEISRYVVVTKKTFLEAFAEIPGPKTNINGKTTSWLVWFMFLGVLPAIIGMGGLVGAVAEAGTNLLPSINIEIWVVLSYDRTTHISIFIEGSKFVPASATAPTNPPIPIIAGNTPRNMNHTNQEVVFPFIFVFGPGISAKASRKVFLVTTTYLLISA